MTPIDSYLPSEIFKLPNFYAKRLDQSTNSRYYIEADIKISKLRMSYSGNTLAFQAKARGSIPLIRFFFIVKVLAYRRMNFFRCGRLSCK